MTTDTPVPTSSHHPILLCLYAAPAVVGGYLALPHLAHEIWYDEAYTLINYVKEGPLYAFTDYSAPNNHILFTALLSFWRNAVLGIEQNLFLLRLLPMGVFLVSTLACVAVGRLSGNRSTGLIAGLLFATSHVTLNFAVELRGYGLSWLPVIAGWGALLLDLRRPRWWSALIYGVAAMLAVGIIPTNLMPFAVLAAWTVLLALPGRPWQKGRRLLRLFYLSGIPLAGLGIYAGVWEELLAQARKPWTGERSAWSVIGEWYSATCLDLWWLWPLLAIGVVQLIRQARHERTWSPTSPRGKLTLLGTLLVLPPILLHIPAHTPYPRNLVPLLPLWYGVMTWVCLSGVALLAEWLQTWCNSLRQALLISISLLLVITAYIREQDSAGLASRCAEGEVPLGLYDQFYHCSYHPKETALQLRKLAARQPTTIFADNSDLWGMMFAYSSVEFRNRPPFIYHETLLSGEALTSLVSNRRVLLVCCGRERALGMARHLQHLAPKAFTPARPPEEIANTGFFKIYDCPLE